MRTKLKIETWIKDEFKTPLARRERVDHKWIYIDFYQLLVLTFGIYSENCGLLISSIFIVELLTVFFAVLWAKMFSVVLSISKFIVFFVISIDSENQFKKKKIKKNTREDLIWYRFENGWNLLRIIIGII